MEPSPKPLPGDKRTWTSLRMFIELRHETTLHIPFREASKVLQWIISLQQRLTRLLGLAMGWIGRDSSSTSKARIRLN